jgi:hypothetical protein
MLVQRLLTALAVVLWAIAAYYLWTFAGRWYFDPDACLDAGGSFNYLLCECSKIETQPYIDIPLYRFPGFSAMAAAVVAGSITSLALFRISRTSKQYRNHSQIFGKELNRPMTDISKDTLQGYPLSPVDAFGHSFSVGARVHILSVASCATDLPSEDQIALKSYEGKDFTVVDIDEYGMLWFDTDGGLRSFCLLAREVVAI